jgi:hypothetical protein
MFLSYFPSLKFPAVFIGHSESEAETLRMWFFRSSINLEMFFEYHDLFKYISTNLFTFKAFGVWWFSIFSKFLGLGQR